LQGGESQAFLVEELAAAIRSGSGALVKVSL
jgi:hypothetical protein